MIKRSQRESSPLRASAVLNPTSLGKILRMGMVGDALAALLDGGSQPAPQPPAEAAPEAAPEAPLPSAPLVSSDSPPAVAPAEAPADAPAEPPTEAPATDLPAPTAAELRQASIAEARRHTDDLAGRLTKAFDSLETSGDEPASPSELTQAFEPLLTPTADGEIAVGSAMMLVEAIVRRIQALGHSSIPDLRVYGGEATHSINVFLLSVAIGVALEQSWDDLISLGQAALLHDVGMVKISRKLTFKDTPLTPYEERVLERHVEYGLDVLKHFQESFPKLNQDVYQGVRCHHEQWDGQGYPQGLKGCKIPLAARIIAVADHYVDRTEDHVGRPRVTPSEAYHEILALSGKAFDPQVVAAFREVIVLYPVQSLVQLESGRLAQVVTQGRKPDLPVVQLGLGEGTLDLGCAGSPGIVRRIFPRKHPRVSLELPAVIRIRGEDAIAPGRIVDLSLGGAGVVVAKAFAVGTRVTLNIATADMEIVTVDGVVAWRSPQASGQCPMGIRFESLDTERRKDLEKLMGEPRSWSWKRA